MRARACIAILIGCSSLILSACIKHIDHHSEVHPDFEPPAEMLVQIASLSNETGEEFEFDIARMLSDSLANHLDEKMMLWNEGMIGYSEDDRIRLVTQIIDYQVGNALKRGFQIYNEASWTILKVECLIFYRGELVGNLDASRIIAVNNYPGLDSGRFGTDAKRRIFDFVAHDITEELELIAADTDTTRH